MLKLTNAVDELELKSLGFVKVTDTFYTLSFQKFGTIDSKVVIDDRVVKVYLNNEESWMNLPTIEYYDNENDECVESHSLDDVREFMVVDELIQGLEVIYKMAILGYIEIVEE